MRHHDSFARGLAVSLTILSLLHVPPAAAGGRRRATAASPSAGELAINAGKNLTHIKIRVGIFGDEQMSISILEKIRNGL